MNEFILFSLYLFASATLLVVVPVMMVPGLATSRKLLICGFAFMVLVPMGMFLYMLLGVPKMAVIG